MGTTNQLLQTALRKRMHSSRQPEAAVVTYCHTVGEKRPGIKSTLTKKARCMMTH